jgi:hypothetical protein
MAEVESIRHRRRNAGYFSSRIEVEELLPNPYSHPAFTASSQMVENNHTAQKLT